MKRLIDKARSGGIPALLFATMLIILILGVQFYMSVRHDEKDAQKLVNREVKIVEQYIKTKLRDAEFSMDDMQDDVLERLSQPDEFPQITERILRENSFLKAAAIAFVPYFYPEKGYWFEPRSTRRGNDIISGVIGGRYHDYTQMKWYLAGMETEEKNGVWSSPYVDRSQENAYIMSLSLPLYHQKKKVGVLCLDVELAGLKKLLRKIEPYPGSECWLLDKDGTVLVSSDSIDISNGDFFVDSKYISISDMTVLLACPKKAVYGDSTKLNLVIFGLLFLGMLLLGYIVQHTVRTILHLHEARQQQQIMDQEMRIAHDIQMDILRSDFPQELCATLLPMKEVGGDLYDFYQQDHILYFIIGDVSGKGVPATMMMAATVNLFRMAASHFSTPAEIMGEINRILSARNPSMMFVTAFVGKMDTQHGLLTYCNAGHNPPILNMNLLATDPDIPLGYQADYDYHQYGAMFPEGSRIVLYTDGISESRNEDHQLMGTQRLLSIVNSHYTEPVGEMTAHIVNDTRRYAGRSEQVDDMTLMCIANDSPQQVPALSITNEIEELQRVKSLLREYCDCLGCGRKLTRKILLAVEEAVANIINYAYPRGVLGQISIDIQGTPASGGDQKGDLTISITDSGDSFDPTARQQVDVEQTIGERQVGGLGIYLYQQLMDSVVYERTDDGRNILIMTKEINS